MEVSVLSLKYGRFVNFRPSFHLTFQNILVHPTQSLLQNPAGAYFRGGPDWRCFPVQSFARQCWGPVPFPVDVRPHRHDGLFEDAEAGIWCGPISFHYGHMIADFGMRIAASAELDETTPLVFSLWDVPCAEPLSFFWDIIDCLKVDRKRIRIVLKPTRFGHLHVLPQSERRFGGGPGPKHLARMDALSGRAPDLDMDAVFVSRAYLPKGRFAGEAYLDAAFAKAGVTVFHPETVSLPQQLETYRRARHLIFSEGSAVHSLQLLGRLSAKVTVLVRRSRNRIAASSLNPRVEHLRYLGVTKGLIHGLRPSGHAQHTNGISILNEDRLLGALTRVGINLRDVWSSGTYCDQRDTDVSAWVNQRLEAAAHPREARLIERQVRILGLSGDGRLSPEAGFGV